MIQIDADEWNFIQEKYGKLIEYIARRIYPDPSYDLEDLVSMLNLQIFNAVEGYHKKFGTNPKEFIRTKDFGKYLKSTLWNKRNSEAAEFARQYEFLKDRVELDAHSVEGHRDYRDHDSTKLEIEDRRQEINLDSFNEDEIKFIDLLLNQRGYIKGRTPNFKKIGDTLDISPNKAKKIYYTIVMKAHNNEEYS